VIHSKKTDTYRRFIMIKKFKPSLVALGLSAALVAGSASAALTLDANGQIFLEDDDIDFVFDADLNPIGGEVLGVGDILFSVLEFNEANGDNIEATTGLELTGVAAGQIVDITGNLITFNAYEGGLNEILSLYGGALVPNGDAGEGAIMALWLGDPDLDINAGSLPNLSCDSLTECLAQATDGDLWEVDSFTGEEGSLGGTAPGGFEFWNSVALTLDTQQVLDTSPASELAFFNAGATITYDGSGLGLGEGDGIACGLFCAPGGTVDGRRCSGAKRFGTAGGWLSGNWRRQSPASQGLMRVNFTS
jgi:hypothetical protein